MNRRTAIKLAFTGATTVGLAGCTDSGESQSTTESTENAEPAIRDLRINNERPSEYEVSFPTGQSVDSGSLSEEEALQQVADQFKIDLQYESPVQTESTLHLEYDDRVIPKEDEEPIDQDIDTVTKQGTITHDTHVPENLIRYMLKGNPRNLELTIRARNPETDQVDQDTIALHYGDAAAEAGITNEFHDLPVNLDERMMMNELTIQNGEINIVYSTTAELGTREFGFTFADATGVCNGAMLQTRTPYTLEMTVIGGEGEEYEISIGQERAEDLITSGVDNSNYILNELKEYDEEYLE